MTSQARRVVIKVGSSSLTSIGEGLRSNVVRQIADIVGAGRSEGIESILVSSGAVASGAPLLGLPLPIRSAPLRRAAASVGQMRLMEEYTKACSASNTRVGQVLLTRRDFALRAAYDSVRETLETLLSQGVLPIINENDPVSLRGDSFGDNDMLSALVASLLHADLLIIFTDTDGVYTADPRKNPAAQKIACLTEVDEETLAKTSSEGSAAGTGGMAAKLRAAHQALMLGVRSYIGSLDATPSLAQIACGQGLGTYIGGAQEGRRDRKYQWIAFHSPVLGSITIDRGAIIALSERGKSLLPAGVIAVHGHFPSGGVITVCDEEGVVVAKGITNYTSEQIGIALGKPTSFARSTLKIEKDEVIHRDNLIVFL